MSEHEDIMKKMQEENVDFLKTRLVKTERGLELTNRMLQEMMKKLNVEIPIPQLEGGEKNIEEDEDGERTSEE
ncbi:uncharacterized protein DS421_13g401810 [Arachis hypogaea]|nr:uncharacterized protein DS421_13g401810 [Arachis hypogaea]